MVVRLDPVRGPLRGYVPLPYSKSVSARQLLIGLHSGVSFVIEGLSEADDTRRLVQIAIDCGYRVENTGLTWRFEVGPLRLPPYLYVGAGGTTLRFILPWLAFIPGRTELHLEGRLAQRPLLPLVKALSEAGARIEEIGSILRVTGNPDWRPHTFQVDAHQSGQFLSAFLLMAPRLEVGSEVIEISGRPATLSYVERLTCTMLQKAGYRWEQVVPGRWVLTAKAPPLEASYLGEADWSGAGYFWGWAMGVAARFELPLSLTSDQPERDFWVEGGWPPLVEADPSILRLTSQGALPEAWEGDVSAVPDTFPTLAALAAISQKPWILRGISTLPYKESDRLWAMQQELSKIGALLEWSGEVCQISPAPTLPRESMHFYSHADHRIAMALSLLATRMEVPLYIHGAEVVSKSFPTYWEALRQTGISLTFET